MDRTFIARHGRRATGALCSSRVAFNVHRTGVRAMQEWHHAASSAATSSATAASRPWPWRPSPWAACRCEMRVNRGGCD